MAVSNSKAQLITDTVSLGPGYANQKWYSLANDEQGTSPKNNWDIAFDASNYGSAIRINSPNGIALWTYPNGTINAWSGVDTSGISSWNKSFNSDTSWTEGAFNQNVSISNPYDLGWGIYSTTTHIVTGDSIYIIKLNDASYRKLIIENLSSGVFTFKYANLDGTGLQNITFTKSNYTGKAFGYYSIQNNASLDREPASANWDLTFCQYTAFIPQAYTVSGILANSGVEMVKISGIGDVESYDQHEGQTLETRINIIGYNWKAFTNNQYVIEDSTVYIVKTAAGDYWKVIPTGFGGSSTGNVIFKKELLSAASITEVNNPIDFVIYPNPSENGQVNIVYDSKLNNEMIQISIIDLNGKVVHNAEKMPLTNQLNIENITTDKFAPGVYSVAIQARDYVNFQKLIIK